MYSRLRAQAASALRKTPYVRSCSCHFSGCADKSTSRPFKDIPGPKSFPLIGTLYKYLPVIGDYSFTKLYETGVKKFKRYGPVVKEDIVPGEPVVWVFRPEDIAEIFKSEAGLHPMRRSHLALLKYRKDRSNIYNTGGLLPTNGDDWWRLRKEFQRVLSKPRNVIEYLEDTDQVVNEFVKLCAKEQFNDFLPLLSRLYLELTCLVAFDIKMNSLSLEERRKNSRSSRLIDAAYDSNSAILRLDNGPRLWRFFDTPLYKKLRDAQKYMEEVALDMVSQKTANIEERKGRSLVDAYLENPALDIKDVVGMACDLLLAGVDTTTYTTSFVLYHLARNPRIQNRMRAEAAALLPDSNQPITAETLRNAAYTKAVIKETFRMNPISVGLGRILQADVVLGGYHVPKGTVVVTQNQITCRLPEYFTDPDTFIPERWLRDSLQNDEKKDSGKAVNPYLLLPFGHGPRSCIARRFAEQSMQVSLLRICRQLNFTWHGGQLGIISLLINKPDGPIKIKFHRK